MKNIYLVRHAKSSWENRSISDFDRTLNDRGKRDAPFMAESFKKKNLKIDRIISSPANRALSTAKIFAKELDIPESQIILNEDIYDASMKDILSVLTGTDDSINNIMLFGHNPGITYLSNYICNFETDNMPTCGIMGMQMDFDSWKYIGNKTCSLKFFEYPKKYL
ncbi:MAG TPA: histidine phosphatase family protein [Ignavibacteriaceae bacterium]|nr:histidine phosphatase family protein [Ignavibacteriaceae bacterium]